MTKPINRLTWKVIEKYGNRKYQGLLTFFVNVTTEEIFPVPVDIEHIDFICKLINFDNRNELRQNPFAAMHLVPSTIHINDDGYIDSVITGVSSLEMGAGVRHSKENIKKAHKLIHDFISNGELPIGTLKEDKPIMQYAA
ncbi:hypothetical protein J4440_03495 [Candidatus Woesearchaeota archaeon]|nr:hypothetical protein [Candidatus Woesearchaeota archaeon]